MTANWAGDPLTWTDGELVAATLNTEIRDRLDWIRAVLLLHGANSDSSLATLWSARYAWSGVLTGQQIADSTDRSLNFPESGNEYKSVATMHDDVNQGRFVAPVSGLYHFTLNTSFEANATNYRSCWLEANNGSAINRVRVSNGGSGTTDLTTCADIVLDVDEFVVGWVRQNSGSALDVDARMQARLVGIV